MFKYACAEHVRLTKSIVKGKNKSKKIGLYIKLVPTKGATCSHLLGLFHRAPFKKVNFKL